MKSQVPPHYRTEDNRTCLDIRLKTAHQLFDGRDPAPFRERDLDEDAVDYIVGAFEEIPAKAPVTIVLWFAEGADASISTSTIREAVHGFFEAEIARIRRRIRQHVKQGQMALGLGLVLLTFFLFLAELSRSLPEGTLREIVREGLVITGWVATAGSSPLRLVAPGPRAAAIRAD